MHSKKKKNGHTPSVSEITNMHSSSNTPFPSFPFFSSFFVIFYRLKKYNHFQSENGIYSEFVCVYVRL